MHETHTDQVRRHREMQARIVASRYPYSRAEASPERIVLYHGPWYTQAQPVAVVASITLSSEGEPIDWAAYIGTGFGDTDEAVVESVRAWGSKLFPDLARGLFPAIDLEYRP